MNQSINFYKNKILKLLLLFQFFAFLLPTAELTAQPCQMYSYTLSSGSWVTRLVFETSKGVTTLDMQKENDWRTKYDKVHVAVNGRYEGTYWLPNSFFKGDIQVFHETDTVYETRSDGRLELRLAMVAKVKACSYWRKIDNVPLRNSVLFYLNK